MYLLCPYQKRMSIRYNEEAVLACLSLANERLTRTDLIADVKEHNTDWNVDHFYMLLRELLVERSSRLEGIGYYLDWLVIKTSTPSAREANQERGYGASEQLAASSVRRTK